MDEKLTAAYLANEITANDILTDADLNRIYATNRKNGYGISRDELIKLCKKHEKARAGHDVKALARIEERLTDINFHTECSLLHSGRYDEALKACNEW